jgi:hypothetical protein
LNACSFSGDSVAFFSAWIGAASMSAAAASMAIFIGISWSRSRETASFVPEHLVTQ